MPADEDMAEDSQKADTKKASGHDGAAKPSTEPNPSAGGSQTDAMESQPSSCVYTEPASGSKGTRLAAKVQIMSHVEKELEYVLQMYREHDCARAHATLETVIKSWQEKNERKPLPRGFEEVRFILSR